MLRPSSIVALIDVPGAGVGGAGAGVITQGGSLYAQLAPAALTAEVQHEAAPPGAEPHPGPPHCPHDLGQQQSPSISPDLHVGSDLDANPKPGSTADNTMAQCASISARLMDSVRAIGTCNNNAEDNLMTQYSRSSYS